MYAIKELQAYKLSYYWRKAHLLHELFYHENVHQLLGDNLIIPIWIEHDFSSFVFLGLYHEIVKSAMDKSWTKTIF